MNLWWNIAMFFVLNCPLYCLKDLDAGLYRVYLEPSPHPENIINQVHTLTIFCTKSTPWEYLESNPHSAAKYMKSLVDTKFPSEQNFLRLSNRFTFYEYNFNSVSNISMLATNLFSRSGDWRLVSQYVLVSSPPYDLWSLSESYCLKVAVLFLWGSLSDERTGLQWNHSMVRVAQNP
jgi:hypothetical protein